CVGLSWIYMRYVEPAWLEVTHKSVPVKGGASSKIRILHLSDFHASDVVPFELIEEAIDLGLKQKPDLICLTGDFISWGMPSPGRYQNILSKMSKEVPTYASLGNHDGGRWAGPRGGFTSTENIEILLANANIKVLRNTAVDHDVNGRVIRLVGLGDQWAKDLKPEEAFRGGETEKTTVVLSHNPDSRSSLKPYPWDLMLCGHTHGGQLVIPVLGARPFVPIHDSAFSEGLIEWDDRYIHVTRGVGNLHGMRFNCRPEVSLLDV
ncbi:phosphodiesterase YaeI, partial [Verrucomicrobia bacterium]|nr:phosphodiesterase YaeI [Verrucomicrobiota bacterium]